MIHFRILNKHTTIIICTYWIDATIYGTNIRISSNLSSSFDFYCIDTVVCEIRCLQLNGCSQMRLFCNGTGICAVRCNDTHPTTNYKCPIVVAGTIVALSTQQPTVNPSGYPSTIPSTNPSTVPTTIPTAIPTTIPTEQLTNTPTEIPSIIPTQTPTIGAPFFAINLTMNAKFSEDYRKIIICFDIVDMDNNLNSVWNNESQATILAVANKGYNVNITECSPLWSLQTTQLLSTGADCQWINNQSLNENVSLKIGQRHLNEFVNSGIVHIDPDEFSIVITLSGYSQIMINDSLFLNGDIFDNINYNYDSNRLLTFNYTSINGILTKTSILNPIIVNTTYYEIKTQTSNNSIIPQIVVENFAHEIGPCDDLILDARNSYNLGMFFAM